MHWSGDFFSDDYAVACRDAIEQFPEIQFWTYTRVFSAIPILKDTKNLVLYVSLDPVNIQHGLLSYEENKGPDNPNLRYCYMIGKNDFQDVRDGMAPVLVGRNKLRRILGGRPVDTGWLTTSELDACPVDTGKLPLAGGCRACGRCLGQHKRSVWFES